MKRLRIILISFVAMGIIADASLNSRDLAKAQSEQFVWITIDRDELETVVNETGFRSKPFEVYVATVESGIAIARINKMSLEDLSREMHKHFHKCAGFVVHNTLDKASLSIEKSISRSTAEQFVEYTIDNRSVVNRMLSETQESLIRQTIVDLSSFSTRRHDQPAGLQSANHIKSTWESISAGRGDISVEFFDNTNQGSRSTPQPSIILTINGTAFPDEVVVLGAHQDSITSNNPAGLAPGADDNASGIACLTEAIRIIVEKGFRPRRTIQFMAYAAEEVGLFGSRNIAAEYAANDVNVTGVLQLDMTNYTGVPNIDVGIIIDNTNGPQNQFLHDLVNEYLPNLNVVETTCNYACSDHASWHENGFPASFPFESSFQGRNSAIHTGNDTLAQSGGTAIHAENFAKISLAFLGELAKGSIASNSAARFDFDGDRKADISIFRPIPSEWWYLRSSDNGYAAFQFGRAGDRPVPADFTGDGAADIAFWRESTGEWFVLRSEDQSFFSFPFGAENDIPVPADFDGDGVDDPAVFRPSSGDWYVSRSSDGNTNVVSFGTEGDQPLAADYDNDGTVDLALYRPSAAEFWISKSSLGIAAYQFGSVGDLAMAGDFSGDGTDDIATWNPLTGEWLVLRSENESFFGFAFGLPGDLPVPADYDGDGTTDPSVFRTSDRTWYSVQSTSGIKIVAFGNSGDNPLPGSYVVGQ